MTQISSYLQFNGCCREAMTFYQECLGGQLTLQTVGESPTASQFPPVVHSRIMHASLLNNGLVLLGSDGLSQEGLTPGCDGRIPDSLPAVDTITLSLNCTSEREIRSIFSRLSEGGKVTHPLATEFWGALFGMLTDRYGKRWMLNYDQKTLVAEPGKPEIISTFVLDAPASLVFETISRPELVPAWWGPAYLTTEVEKMDVRPGGQWRIMQREPSGEEYSFHGVYHTVQAPELLVYTFEYEGTPNHVLLETISLEEKDGKTRMVDKQTFQSVSDRDAMLAMGMEEGAVESQQRLSALLIQVQKERMTGNIMETAKNS